MGNTTFGDPMPTVKIEVLFNLTLKDKVVAEQSYVSLAQKFLLEDSSVRSYTKEEFLKLAAKRSAAVREETPSPAPQIKVEPLTTPNLQSQSETGKDDPELKHRGNQKTYTVYSKRQPIVESSIFGKLLQISIDTFI